jgi:hypothetical protein
MKLAISSNIVKPPSLLFSISSYDAVMFSVPLLQCIMHTGGFQRMLILSCL